MTFLHALSYVGAIGALLFFVLSLASGLLWIAEIIEERTVTAKAIGIRGTYVIIAIHLLLHFTDGLPLPLLGFSIICHLVYLTNFTNTWPFISLNSLSFLGSCILCVADHFMWFFYFSQRSQAARQRAHRPQYRGGGESTEAAVPGFADIATFFAICVWLVPLFLFLSLSANDNALPITAGLDPGAVAAPNATARPSLFKVIFDTIPCLRPRRTSRNAEGIIAPPTPAFTHTPRASTSSITSDPSFSRSNSFTDSGGSPLASQFGEDVQGEVLNMDAYSQNRAHAIKLGPPPRRSTIGSVNRTASLDATIRTHENPNGDAARRRRVNGTDH